MGQMANLITGRTDAGYGGNFLRGIGQGLTFNSSDEMEAFIRALAAGDINRYRQLKQQVNADYDQWAEANPASQTVAEFGGALAPGVIGAFVPGGQGATASLAARGAGALARASRAMAEPATVALERFAPRGAAFMAQYMPRTTRYVMPVADELLSGAISSAGQADTAQDIPSRITSDIIPNLGFALAVRAGNKGLQKGAPAASKKIKQGWSVLRNSLSVPTSGQFVRGAR